MRQAKIGAELYVFSTEPYEITQDTDVDVVYVQEELLSEYRALNPALPLKKINYMLMRRSRPIWYESLITPDSEVEPSELLSADLSFLNNAYSEVVPYGTFAKGESHPVDVTWIVSQELQNPHNLEYTFRVEDPNGEAVSLTENLITEDGHLCFTCAAQGNYTVYVSSAATDVYADGYATLTIVVAEEAAPADQGDDPQLTDPDLHFTQASYTINLAQGAFDMGQHYDIDLDEITNQYLVNTYGVGLSYSVTDDSSIAYDNQIWKNSEGHLAYTVGGYGTVTLSVHNDGDMTYSSSSASIQIIIAASQSGGDEPEPTVLVDPDITINNGNTTLYVDWDPTQDGTTTVQIPYTSAVGETMNNMTDNDSIVQSSNWNTANGTYDVELTGHGTVVIEFYLNDGQVQYNNWSFTLTVVSGNRRTLTLTPKWQCVNYSYNEQTNFNNLYIASDDAWEYTFKLVSPTGVFYNSSIDPSLVNASVEFTTNENLITYQLSSETKLNVDYKLNYSIQRLAKPSTATYVEGNFSWSFSGNATYKPTNGSVAFQIGLGGGNRYLYFDSEMTQTTYTLNESPTQSQLFSGANNSDVDLTTQTYYEIPVYCNGLGATTIESSSKIGIVYPNSSSTTGYKVLTSNSSYANPISNNSIKILPRAYGSVSYILLFKGDQTNDDVKVTINVTFSEPQAGIRFKRNTIYCPAELGYWTDDPTAGFGPTMDNELGPMYLENPNALTLSYSITSTNGATIDTSNGNWIGAYNPGDEITITAAFSGDSTYGATSVAAQLVIREPFDYSTAEMQAINDQMLEFTSRTDQEIEARLLDNSYLMFNYIYLGNNLMANVDPMMLYKFLHRWNAYNANTPQPDLSLTEVKDEHGNIDGSSIPIYINYDFSKGNYLVTIPDGYHAIIGIYIVDQNTSDIVYELVIACDDNAQSGTRSLPSYNSEDLQIVESSTQNIWRVKPNFAQDPNMNQ